jgi:glutamyl-tRNA reductase
MTPRGCSPPVALAEQEQVAAALSAPRGRPLLLIELAESVVDALWSHADAIRANELARFERRLRELTATERQALETATAAIVNSLLQLPTLRLKEAAVTADGAFLTHALQHLFDLSDAAA